ncbi:MAG TPA: hypothetical protein VM935_15510 [Chitinophagaceae bacterium]|nr:hypothetical protein [Chitinophagaceae bacterium]
MKFLSAFFLVVTFLLSGCDKSEVNANQDPKQISSALKTGNWMILIMENNIVLEGADTFLKFNEAGTLVATKDGASCNGTWTETNTTGTKTFTLNIATSDVVLKKANRAWKVSGIAEHYIDLKDDNAPGNITAQLMKH